MIVEFLSKMFFYGCVGITIEIFFTGFHAAIFEKDVRMPGRSYVWMAPIYGLAAIALGGLHTVLPTLIFIPVALIFIYFAEALSGIILKKVTGKIPWDYGAARWGIAGLVRIDYAPFWIIAIISFDQLSDILDKIFRYVGTLG